MIVEERNYAFAPAELGHFLELYEREGVQIHTRILGTLIGYFKTEVGQDLNEVVHLWGFADMNDRAERRRALWTDPEWLVFAAKSPVPLRMRNRILTPTNFSPLH
jgi:hypothetical protein